MLLVPENRQVLLGMPDIEILNIHTINCNAIDTKEIYGDAVQTQQSPRVQEMGSTIQIQGEKLADWKDAIQTQTVI